MAYTLQAIIARSPLLQASHFPSTSFASLQQGFAILPLVETTRKSTGLDFLPLTDGGETELPQPFLSDCNEIAINGKTAYVEAEYHGGVGIQACVLFENGRQIGPAIVAEDAINQALRFLGATPDAQLDEFESVGLGMQRDTDDWVSA